MLFGRPTIKLLRCWRMAALLEVFVGVCKAAMVWRDAKKLERVSAVKASCQSCFRHYVTLVMTDGNTFTRTQDLKLSVSFILANCRC
jgi:hypothetical protein